MATQDKSHDPIGSIGMMSFLRAQLNLLLRVSMPCG
jgi:hypothetical protein